LSLFVLNIFRSPQRTRADHDPQQSTPYFFTDAPSSILLRVCRQSREEALKVYKYGKLENTMPTLANFPNYNTRDEETGLFDYGAQNNRSTITAESNTEDAQKEIRPVQFYIIYFQMYHSYQKCGPDTCLALFDPLDNSQVKDKIQTIALSPDFFERNSLFGEYLDDAIGFASYIADWASLKTVMIVDKDGDCCRMEPALVNDHKKAVRCLGATAHLCGGVVKYEDTHAAKNFRENLWELLYEEELKAHEVMWKAASSDIVHEEQDSENEALDGDVLSGEAVADLGVENLEFDLEIIHFAQGGFDNELGICIVPGHITGIPDVVLFATALTYVHAYNPSSGHAHSRSATSSKSKCKIQRTCARTSV
jgi:hypothetical protein